MALLERFVQTGRTEDLTEAIGVSGAAVDALPVGHPLRPLLLSNLGIALKNRFDWTGDPAHLAEAIKVGRAAVQTTRRRDPHHGIHLAGLGNALWTRFERTGDIADGDQAIATLRAAMMAAPDVHIGRAKLMSNLAGVLLARFGQTWDQADLVAAIEACQAAAQAMGTDHPHYAMFLNNLGLVLGARFGQTLEPADLAAAIATARDAVNAAPENHPNRVGYLSNLALGLSHQFEIAGEAADLQEAFALWREAAGVSSGPALRRLAVASQWGRTAAAQGSWEEAETAFSTAVELLPLQAWHGLSQHTRQEYLSQSLPVFDGGATVDPAVTLRRRHEARIRAAEEWDRLLADIRARSGFTSFLRPPPFADLAAGLGEGTVVIVNVSGYRCDAVALDSAGLRVILLPGLDLGTAVDQAMRYHQALDPLSEPAPSQPAGSEGVVVSHWSADGPAAACRRSP